MSAEHIIEATGAKWEYRVSSAKNPEQFHLVQLDENWPAGVCTCAQWVCRVNPSNRKTGGVMRCRHILAAREVLLNFVIQTAK